MGLFDRLFGRKKEKKEDIREEEPVQTETSETEDAIEELENENQSQVENAPEESSQEENQPFEEEDKQEFYEELEERLSEDQVLNEVIEVKAHNKFSHNQTKLAIRNTSILMCSIAIPIFSYTDFHQLKCFDIPRDRGLSDNNIFRFKAFSQLFLRPYLFFGD